MKSLKDLTQEELIGKVEELSEWLDSLNVTDRLNFNALIQLPNAAEVLAKCPDKKYQEMGIIALAIVKNQKKSME